MEVTLVDEAPKPGGVCLYRGCMPSKALLHAARVLTEAREAEQWGITIWRADDRPAASAGVEGRGRGEADRRVGVPGEAAGRYLRAGACGVCRCGYVQRRAGGRPVRPEMRGEGSLRSRDHRDRVPAGASGRTLALDDPRVLDSTGALEIDRIPSSLLVVGGGYIGLELGTVYAALGSAVTIVEMTGSLLPGADADLVRVLARRMNSDLDGGAPQHDGARADAGARRDRGDVLGTGWRRRHGGADGGQREWTERFDAVLVAVGRTPNSEIEGLDRTRVERDERGFHSRRCAAPDRRAGDLRDRRRQRASRCWRTRRSRKRA